MKVNTRSWSGVLPVAIALEGHAFSCKFDCAFCPNECVENGAQKTIARSYLSSEGTFIRGEMVNFDAYSQIIRRLLELESMGHYPDKLEIIVLGGTFSCYDKKYRNDFIRDIFYACNIYKMFSSYFTREYYDSVTHPWLATKPFFNKFPLSPNFYSNIRKPFLLHQEQRLNEISIGVRIIGIVLETRPDMISFSSITELRRLGCTRVQLGIQHTSNTILDLNNRGHGVNASLIAIKKLKDNGFKVDGHIMPDLPFSNLVMDYEMSRQIFCFPEYQCDYVKIYPCLDLPYTKARKWKQDGVWTPYAETDYPSFLEYLAYTCTLIPPWTRVNRIHRDFPKASLKNNELGYQSDTVETNMNQFVQIYLKKTGKKCFDIRSREIKNQTFVDSDLDKTFLFIRKYRQHTSTEYFISIEKPNYNSDHFDDSLLLGFARLRILDEDSSLSHCIPSLRSSRISRLRELHVYGFIAGTISKNSIQHKGLGKFLVQISEIISIQNGCNEIAVISGVGVRSYYYRLGYRMKINDLGDYMFKKLPTRLPFILFGISSNIYHIYFPHVFSWHVIKSSTYGHGHYNLGTGNMYAPVYFNTNIAWRIFIIFLFIKLISYIL